MDRAGDSETESQILVEGAANSRATVSSLQAEGSVFAMRAPRASASCGTANRIRSPPLPGTPTASTLVPIHERRALRVPPPGVRIVSQGLGESAVQPVSSPPNRHPAHQPAPEK